MGACRRCQGEAGWFKSEHRECAQAWRRARRRVLVGALQGRFDDEASAFYPYRERGLFILQKTETPIWAFDDVDQHKSTMVARGRHGNRVIEEEEMPKHDNGALLLTTKHIYFSSGFGRIRIPWDNIGLLYSFSVGDRHGFVIRRFSETTNADAYLTNEEDGVDLHKIVEALLEHFR